MPLIRKYGRRINSCLMLAVMTQDKAITTIEGLAHGDRLHPVQGAFLEHDGFQCGYCTIANAVYHATGRRIRDLPIAPEKRLSA